MQIPISKETLARKLILAGTTTRNVGRMAGLGRMTAWRLSKMVLEGRPPPRCGCGRLAKHVGMCGYRLSKCESYLARRLKRMASVNIYVPKPRYDYSQRAEIGLLVKRWYTVCLDVGGSEFIDSGQLDPLEILMRKEEHDLLQM